MEAIENIIVTPIEDLALRLGFASDLLLAAFGAALVVVLFLISLIIKGGSRPKLFIKKLKDASLFLNTVEEITEENVEVLNNKIKTMPESVIRGWGFFLEQKAGYPSDYITARDTLCDPKLSPKSRAGRTFLRVTSAIVVVLTIWLEYVIGKGASLGSVGISDFTYDFELTASIIAVFCAPLLFYVILGAVLAALYRKQSRMLETAFSAFQNALDAKVLIYAEEEDVFVSENIGEINAEIEEIIAEKLDNKEIIEIVTAPIAAPEEIEAPAIEAVPAPEAVSEEIPELSPEEVVAERARLQGLIEIINTAVNRDPHVTKADIEELALIMNEELQSPYHNAEDRAILEECMYKLAAKHEKFMKARK